MISLVLMAVQNHQQASAGSVSKKFMKGFLLGAYMAKHHKPVIVVTKKHGWVDEIVEDGSEEVEAVVVEWSLITVIYGY